MGTLLFFTAHPLYLEPIVACSRPNKERAILFFCFCNPRPMIFCQVALPTTLMKSTNLSLTPTIQAPQKNLSVRVKSAANGTGDRR